MPRPMSVSESVVIAVDPVTVYAHVSDPTQTGRWSPENRGARLDRPGAVQVGTTFVGRNQRGRYRWVTRCRVTAADPGQRFAFRVEAIGRATPRLPGLIATWAYELEAVPARPSRSSTPATSGRRWTTSRPRSRRTRPTGEPTSCSPSDLMTR